MSDPNAPDRTPSEPVERADHPPASSLTPIAPGDADDAGAGLFSSADSADASGEADPNAGTPLAPMKANRNSNSVNTLIREANALFSAKSASSSHGEDTPDEVECWLLRMNGRDFGPFDGPGVRERIESEEVNEHTLIIDTRDGSMGDLADMPKFADFMMDYVVIRERRKIEEQERREDLIQDVKRRSVRATVTVALGSVLLAAMGLFALDASGVLKFSEIGETIRPSPLEFPFAQAVRSYRYRFEVSEPEYEGMEVDSSLIASLFADPAAARRGGSGSAGGGGGLPSAGGGLRSGSSSYDEDSVAVISFDSDAPSSRLNQGQINQTVGANSGRIQNCFAGEMQRNPAFRGVDLTFSINPDGGTFNIRVASTGPRSSAVETCLVQAVRSMRFPAFNDLPMNVSFPFYVR